MKSGVLKVTAVSRSYDQLTMMWWLRTGWWRGVGGGSIFFSRDFCAGGSRIGGWTDEGAKCCVVILIYSAPYLSAASMRDPYITMVNRIILASCQEMMMRRRERISYSIMRVKTAVLFILVALMLPLSAGCFSAHSSRGGISRTTAAATTRRSSCFLFQLHPQDPSSSLLSKKSDNDDHNAPSMTMTTTTRRKVLLSTTTCTVAAAASVVSPATAATDVAMLLDPNQAVVTDKVFFNVRISRQDGTFYVRDDLPDTPENTVFQGRLVMGLFGKAAPNHVERFLNYVNAGFNPLDDDNPLPSYSRSTFPQFDQATGVLYGGTIPSLEVTEIQGSTALKYGGRLLPAKLWVDKPPKISHSAKGLLTHKQLDATPVFGITTRTDTTELDRTHTVFGKILPDDSSSDFFQRVTDLPTYSVDRRPIPDEKTTTSSVTDDAAQLLYAAQRDFFRGAAKSFGDTRVGKVYEGKLLRRVEVTQTGTL